MRKNRNPSEFIAQKRTGELDITILCGFGGQWKKSRHLFRDDRSRIVSIGCFGYLLGLSGNSSTERDRNV